MFASLMVIVVLGRGLHAGIERSRGALRLVADGPGI